MFAFSYLSTVRRKVPIMKLLNLLIVLSMVWTGNNSVTIIERHNVHTEEYEPKLSPPPNCETRRSTTGKYDAWFLEVLFISRGRYAFRCPASQVDEGVALTRARCIVGIDEDDFYIRPHGVKQDEPAVVIKSWVINDTEDTALLFFDKPTCVRSVCFPVKSQSFSWKHCFTVGRNREPDHISDEERPCEVHYRNITRPEEVKWGNPLVKRYHFAGLMEMGSCAVYPGSPLMCAAHSSPTEYVQAGIVVNKTDFETAAQNRCPSINDVDLERYCNILDIRKIKQKCRGLRDNEIADICKGFDVLPSTGLGQWINEEIRNRKKIKRFNASFQKCDYGTVTVQRDEFPWIVPIFYEEESEEDFKNEGAKFVCAATVINSQMALTERSCVKPFRSSTGSLYIRTGVRNLDHVNECGQHEKRILSYVNAPQDDKDDEAGIAVVYWTKPLKLKYFVRRATDANFVNKSCFTLGWGHYKNGNTPFSQATLKKVKTTIVDRSSCYYSVRNTRDSYIRWKELEYLVCAGGKERVDTCQTDIGGPLLCQQEDDTFVQVALLHSAPGCGEKEVPNLYNNLTKYKAVIDKLINETLQNHGYSSEEYGEEEEGKQRQNRYRN